MGAAILGPSSSGAQGLNRRAFRPQPSLHFLIDQASAPPQHPPLSRDGVWSPRALQVARGFVCLGSGTSDWLRLKLFVGVGAGARPARAIGHLGQARAVIGGGPGPGRRRGRKVTGIMASTPPLRDRLSFLHRVSAGARSVPAGASSQARRPCRPPRPSPSPRTRRGQVTPALHPTHLGQCGPGNRTRTGKAAGGPGFWFLAQPKAALQKNPAAESVPDKPSRTPGTSLARGKALSSGPICAGGPREGWGWAASGQPSSCVWLGSHPRAGPETGPVPPNP